MAARRKKAEPAPPVAPAAVVVTAPAPLAAPASVSLSRDLGVVGDPCDPARAAPLRVTATLRGPVVSVPGLDSLLAYAVALLAGREPLTHGDAGPLVEIPILREPAGRFHLCSAPVYAEAHYETRHRNRRFPMAEAQMLAAPDVRRINIQNGATKSFRVPYQQVHLADNEAAWACVGDADRIRDLLRVVGYLGRQRGVGKGPVLSWRVEPIDPWPGFPVVKDGRPTRPLPPDWPGVTCATRSLGVLTYPYWDKTARVPCLLA